MLRSEVGSFAAQAAFMAAAAVLVCGTLVGAFSFLTAATDDAILLREIRAAFAEGTLVTEDRLLNDRQIGAFQFNDCAILLMAADAEGTVLERVLSPSGRPPLDLPAGGIAEVSACSTLEDIAVAGNDAAYGYDPYHRYLHGERALAEALVPVLGVQGTREVLIAANRLVLLSVLVVCLWRMREGARRPNLALAVTTALLLTMSGVDYFGQSLSMGPADLAVHLMFALLVVFGPLRMPRRRYVAIIAASAVFVAYFEFLTGEIPLSIAIALLLPAFHVRSDADVREAALRGAFGTVTFVVVCAAMFAWKFWITAQVFGPEVWADIAGQLDRRTSLEGYSLAEVFMRLAYRTHHIAFGSVVLGLAYLISALSVFAVCLSRDLAAGWGRGERWRLWRAIGFLLGAGSVLVWYTVFSSHTAIHSWFMIRPLALCCAVAFGYLWLVTPADGAERRYVGPAGRL